MKGNFWQPGRFRLLGLAAPTPFKHSGGDDLDGREANSQNDGDVEVR